MVKEKQKQLDPDRGKGAENADEDGLKRRRYKRRTVLWPATLHVGQHDFSCQIWNLSLGGARVRVDIPLKEGTEITLKVPGRGDLPAVIAWSEQGALGLDFTVPKSLVRTMFKDRLHILGLG